MKIYETGKNRGDLLASLSVISWSKISNSKFGMPNSTGRKSFTLKAFYIVAQGRRAAAHPGLQDSENLNPERVGQNRVRSGK